MVMSLLEALRLTFRGVNCIVRWRSLLFDDRVFGDTVFNDTVFEDPVSGMLGDVVLGSLTESSAVSLSDAACI